MAEEDEEWENEDEFVGFMTGEILALLTFLAFFCLYQPHQRGRGRWLLSFPVSGPLPLQAGKGGL